MPYKIYALPIANRRTVVMLTKEGAIEPYFPPPAGVTDYNGQNAFPIAYQFEFDNGDATSTVFTETLEAGGATP
jgi:hypothetical protein